MKLFYLVILISVAFCVSAPQNPQAPNDDDENVNDLLVETQPEGYKVEDLVNAEMDTRASETDVTYHFFSQRDPVEGTKIKSTNVGALLGTEFSVFKDTLFIIHGWQGSNVSSSNYNIRGAILAKYDINVFVVDWSPLAGRNYISAKNSVVTVGRFVADFIRSLVVRYWIRVSQVSFVGFSLGAHVSGNAGAALNGQVDHIVGLDPAGPLFTVRNIDERLDPTDARYVQVIHTNGGLLGFGSPSGHSDYYPNGGSSQPGCGIDLVGSCAHNRAYLYYSEAILANVNRFVARRCGSHRDFTRGRCNDNPTSVMGGYTIDRRANGEYYLSTNRNSPFALG